MAGARPGAQDPVSDVSAEEGSNGTGVYSRIEASIAALRAEQDVRLNRIEDKLDTRMTTLDRKVDELGTRQDRLEGKLDGSLGMLKWLGPTGVAAVIWGLLKAAGVL